MPLQLNYSAQKYFPRCNYLGTLCSERDAGGGGIKTLSSLITMRESLAIPEQHAEQWKTRVISKQNSIYIQIRNQVVPLKRWVRSAQSSAAQMNSAQVSILAKDQAQLEMSSSAGKTQILNGLCI